MPRNRSSTAEKPRSQSPSVALSVEEAKATADPFFARLADLGLVILFLALTFLLGVFPLKDTDFWWHLRTGDLIRQTWRIPVKDWYTFGAADHYWIDLHWGFELLISWGYQLVGIPGLNIGKCVITCAALLALITAKRKSWPIAVMLLAWLPGLLVLSGRMYLRPETLTLLYLALFLAILFRWQQYPRLAFVLPFVQVLWVNTQGLFVLGIVVLGFAILDAAVAPGAFAPARRPWWRTIGIASALTCLACVLNPYGLLGAFFPIQLAQTMSNPIFEQTIAELMPVLTFVDQMGVKNLPLQLHILTVVVGGMSFLLPILWRVSVRVTGRAEKAAAPLPKGKRARKAKDAQAAAREEVWRISLFRVLLFTAFTVLSLKATRNSHQFAAVVGCVTAWNFGEWAAAVRQVRASRAGTSPRPFGLSRVVAMATLVALLTLVGSGQFYTWAAEGRTIGLGEEPLWFPHAAARFAGRPGMPERFICFHNGHAGLYEYYNGPDRKVYADARLEVMGPDVYGKYVQLERLIQGRAKKQSPSERDGPDWQEELRELGNPGILVDNVHSELSGLARTLFLSSDWRCVWFDATAAVFVPQSLQTAPPPVDFWARLFQPDSATEPRGLPALNAAAKALYNVAFQIAVTPGARAEKSRPMLLLGLAYARKVQELDPKDLDGWKYGGLLESLREPIGTPEDPIPRFRLPFDPVFDLSAARATYALRNALARNPDDSKSLFALAVSYQSRGMNEAALPLWQHIGTLAPTNQKREIGELVRSQAIREGGRIQASLGKEPPTEWQNMDELDKAVEKHLATGRAAGAFDLLARAHRPGGRSWEVADRLATIQLHLGDPAVAREVWRDAKPPSRRGLQQARIAASYLAEGIFTKAREAFKKAISVEPKLFEAWYGLAVLERDDGHAPAALEAARNAVADAPTDVAREAALAIVQSVEPYTTASARAGRLRVDQ